MSGQYSPYSHYKESNIDWLGNIPEHWSTSKLRYKFSFGKGLSITKENLKDSGVPCVNYGEVHSKYGFEVDPNKHPLKCVSEEYLTSSPNSLLQQGDIVFADTSEDIEGSGNFTQLVSQNNVFAGYHTIICRPLDRDNARFFAYLLDSKELRTQIQHSVKGVKVFSVTQAILRGTDIWLPSDEEQSVITNFLDHETRKIDTLIEKQQQLIKFLIEKCQAEISHAVTRGLNPDVTMKDSGVEWLGNVPEHWDVRKAKYLFQEMNRPVKDSDEIVTVFRDGQVCLRSRRRETGFTMAILEHGYQSIEKGDLVLHSMDAFAGAIGVSEDNGRCTPEYVVTTPYDMQSNCEYYAHVLRLMAKRDFIFVICPSVRERAPRFRYSKFQDVLLPVPPKEEQDNIFQHIQSMSYNCSVLIEKANNQIQLLSERRNALISAAVTGKIDVRNWQPETQPAQANAS